MKYDFAGAPSGGCLGAGEGAGKSVPWVLLHNHLDGVLCQTLGMNRSGWVGVACGVAVLASGCIAPDVEVIGAIGVTADEQSRPVLVVEACEGAAALVSMSYDREGLADDEPNEDLGMWTATAPVSGTSKIILNEPEPPWQGEGVDLALNRGYVAGGQGEKFMQVLTQVSFRGTDLAEMDPGFVYRNDTDLLTKLGVEPGASDFVASTPAEFAAEVCNRA